MKQLLSLVCGSVLSLVLLFSPSFVFADTYGSGAYGSGVYGTGQTNNSGGGSSSNSVGSAIAAFFCTNQAPSSAPNLYQINVTNNSATLYFSPAGGPYDRHFISYGQGNNSEGYGVEVGGSSTGALTYQINQLSPSSIYTFKVRGGNGCEPGPWSGNLTIKTQGKNSKIVAKFYPNQQAQYVVAKAQSNIAPSKTAPVKAETKQQAEKQSSTKQTTAAKTEQTSWWGGVTNFFSTLFH